MAKCTCFDDNLKMAEEKIRAAIPEGSIDIKISWKDYAYFMQGDYSPVNPSINYEYRLPKKGGGFRVNLTKLNSGLVANYCCYCGRELAQSGKK